MEGTKNRLIIVCENVKNNPHCVHGPTLLYKRESGGKETQQYYACSAYQNRRDCSFMYNSRVVEERKKKILIQERRKLLSQINAAVLGERLEKIKSLKPSDRLFCVTCNKLLFSEEMKNSHDDHTLKHDITDYLLTHPSQLLSLQSDSRREAQFMFSESTIDVILNGLKMLNFEKLICMGTPTIHERVSENRDRMESIFLDIDHRYIQFYGGDRFCWFNMMNCFPMRGQDSLNRVKDFLHSDKVAVLMDPPFSARSEPLAYTLSQFNSIYQQQLRETRLPVIWIFPYFKESVVLSAWPKMTMLDYDVKYKNHKKFKECDKTSVIRIFTNLDPSKFAFPEEEGYRYCKKCKRWISKYNKHCSKCQICPSKNGQPYKHCNACSRCVKHSWQHCATCNRCALPKHPCEKWQMKNVETNTPEQKDTAEESGPRKRKSPFISSKIVKKRKKRNKTNI